MERQWARARDMIRKENPRQAMLMENLWARPFCTWLVRTRDELTGTHSPFGIATPPDANRCFLFELWQSRVGPSFSLRIPSIADIITAFYLPLGHGIEEVRLEVGGQYVGEWTPEGSEFCAPRAPLPLLLDEARALPSLLHTFSWQDLLWRLREGKIPPFFHTFARNLEIGGVTYRRVVLVEPCLVSSGCCRHEIRLRVTLQDEDAPLFPVLVEYWVIGDASLRNSVAAEPHVGVGGIESITARAPPSLRVEGGMMGMLENEAPSIDPLLGDLQQQVDLARSTRVPIPRKSVA